jgi:hypothetical protein
MRAGTRSSPHRQSPRRRDAVACLQLDQRATRRVERRVGAVREHGSVRAQAGGIVKRILRKYGYPPDKQEAATNSVLQQTELLPDFRLEVCA